MKGGHWKERIPSSAESLWLMHEAESVFSALGDVSKLNLLGPWSLEPASPQESAMPIVLGRHMLSPELKIIERPLNVRKPLKVYLSRKVA